MKKKFWNDGISPTVKGKAAVRTSHLGSGGQGRFGVLGFAHVSLVSL